MRILKIELENNPILGTMSFDFTNDNGKPYDNIVFAGENGCGKTTLLNIIFDFTNMSKGKEFPTEENRTFYVRLTNEEINRFNQRTKDTKLSGASNYLKISIMGRDNDWTGIAINSYDVSDNHLLAVTEPVSVNLEYKDVFKSVYSPAEISYNPEQAKRVTSMEIDEDFVVSLKSGEKLASEIQQLFIDVYTNDATELNEWVINHLGQVPPKSLVGKRMKRFKRAFSRVFDDLNVDSIVTVDNHKNVLFKKNNSHIDISKLSSGEKQIVFRGAFLLQRQQVSLGYPVLIDEPEISMHPMWQRRIFDYYRSLFTAGNNVQTSQIFMATHSPYVIESALNTVSNSIVFCFDSTEKGIRVRRVTAPFVLPTITSAELNYEVFNIPSRDYHNELYGYVQRLLKTTTSVKSTDEAILNESVFDKSKHFKPSVNKNNPKTKYSTLPTYIRNLIDHPDMISKVSDNELRTSILLLRSICEARTV